MEYVPLRRLAYCSRSAVPMSRSREVLREIVEQSMIRNAAANVTGALTLVQDVYYQVLEGEHDAVERLLERIRADRRHTSLRVVDDVAPTSRLFDDWSMRFTIPRSNERERAYAMLGTLLENRSGSSEEMLALLRNWTSTHSVSLV